MKLAPPPFHSLPARHFRVALADPAWNFASGPGRHPSRHYSVMKLPDIKALPVRELTHPDGMRVLLWVTLPFLQKGFEVLDAWGARYSTARGWVKTWNGHEGPVGLGDLARGTGYEVIGNLEMLLIGKIGACRPITGRKPLSVMMSPRREHSRKPDDLREQIEANYRGPHVELFSRTDRPFWSAWGDQTGKFSHETA